MGMMMDGLEYFEEGSNGKRKRACGTAMSCFSNREIMETLSLDLPLIGFITINRAIPVASQTQFLLTASSIQTFHQITYSDFHI